MGQQCGLERLERYLEPDRRRSRTRQRRVLSHIMCSYQDPTEDDTAGHENVVSFHDVTSKQFLGKDTSPTGDFTNHTSNPLPRLSVSNDAAPETSQRRLILGLSTVTHVQLHPQTLGKWQRENLSGMTTVMALPRTALHKQGDMGAGRRGLANILLGWVRGEAKRDATCFASPSDRDLCVSHHRAIPGHAHRARTWRNEHQIQGLLQKRSRGFRILQGNASLAPRLKAPGCHVHRAQPHGANTWQQAPLLTVATEMFRAVTHGCAWDIEMHKEEFCTRSKTLSRTTAGRSHHGFSNSPWKDLEHVHDTENLDVSAPAPHMEIEVGAARHKRPSRTKAPWLRNAQRSWVGCSQLTRRQPEHRATNTTDRMDPDD